MALGLSEDHLELATVGGADMAEAATVRARRGACPSGGTCRAARRPGLRLLARGAAAVALEELGRALVPGGFLPTVLASAVLGAAGPAGAMQKLLTAGWRTGRCRGGRAARRAGRHDRPATA